jgi:hypothetical protein
MKREFFEWYQEQKDKAREIMNDPELPSLEIKKIFIENAVDHIGLWKKDRRLNGTTNGTSQQNGSTRDSLQQNVNVQKPVQDAQGQGRLVDPKVGWKSEVLRLLNEFPQNLERKSQSKIKIIKEIPRSDWNEVKEGFEKEGWKYDWKEKAFLVSGEAKA